MKFGGLPAAVAEAATGAVEPSEEVKRVLYDSLVKEVQRRGASVPAAHALLERVLRSLGSRTDWSRMAREMDVPLSNRRGGTSHHTLRDYIELLAGGYFLFILYFWRAGSQTNSLSNEKKVFFADPLLHTIALEHAPGLIANVPALIENAVGLALYRRYEPPKRLIESFSHPTGCTRGAPPEPARSTSWRVHAASLMSSRSSTGARSTCAAQRASRRLIPGVQP